jgi:arsenical pump membrane protein
MAVVRCLSEMSGLQSTQVGGGVSANPRGTLAGWLLAAVGVAAALVSVGLDRTQAQSAASQVWSPFVLVAGLLLIGLVADEDGLFAATGRRLATLAPNGTALFAGAAMIIAVVTALLNLDTSVVFLTPVLVYAARSRGQGEVPLLVACLLLSNAGSMLLPGSNLTNLIVLGHLHLSGSQFFRHMALPWVASVVLTASVIAIIERRSLRTNAGPAAETGDELPVGLQVGPAVAARDPLTGRLGTLGVLAATVLVLILRSPALPVAGIGVAVIALRLATRREHVRGVVEVLGLPVLIGLFGTALALGTLGRSWSGPATLLAHLDGVGTAAVAAGSAVLVNNLPAASLLAARVPPHPFALLVGLNIGPNLFVTGSLAWILWWRTARTAGSNPPVGRAILLGLVTVPLSMAAALGMLALTGSL